MEKYITDERTGLEYELVSNYYLLCLKTLESPKIGRFGMMYHECLRNHKRAHIPGFCFQIN